MSDKVAKFALEAMSEDEPKYTEKEMDVLHKKAKLEAAQALESERQALLAQMHMMEAKMQALQAEKARMKREMDEVHELVKGFEAMTETVARKKDDEIYSLFEAKKQTEQKNKELLATVEQLTARDAASQEAKAASHAEHAKAVASLQDAHRSEVAALLARLQGADDVTVQTRVALADVQRKLVAAEKHGKEVRTFGVTSRDTCAGTIATTAATAAAAAATTTTTTITTTTTTTTTTPPTTTTTTKTTTTTTTTATTTTTTTTTTPPPPPPSPPPTPPPPTPPTTPPTTSTHHPPQPQASEQCAKLEEQLKEANASVSKYKQIGTKTRDQAQAQLDKAKALVVGE